MDNVIRTKKFRPSEVEHFIIQKHLENLVATYGKKTVDETIRLMNVKAKKHESIKTKKAK